MLDIFAISYVILVLATAIISVKVNRTMSRLLKKYFTNNLDKEIR